MTQPGSIASGMPADEATTGRRITDLERQVRELGPSVTASFNTTVAKLTALVEDLQTEVDNLLSVEVNTGNVNATGNVSASGNVTAGGRVTSVAALRSPGSRTYVVTGGVIGSYAGAWVDGDGTVGISPSSVRFKTDIEAWAPDISRLLELRAVMFRYNFPGMEQSPKQLGFIAEELDALGFPEFLFYDADGLVEGINYDRLTVALLVLAQQQETRLVALEEWRDGS